MAANQSSRGALIAWTVVTSVLAVTMMVLAIVFYVGQKNAELREETLTNQNKDVYDATYVTGPQVAQVKEAKKPNENLLAASVRMTRDLSQLVSGTDTSAQAAQDAGDTQKAAKAAVDAANKSAELDKRAAVGTLDQTSLTATIRSLQGMFQSSISQVNQLTQQLAAAQAERGALVKQQQEQTAKKDQEVADANQRAQAALAKTEDLQSSYTQQVNSVNTSASQQIATAADAARTQANQVRDLQQQITSLTDDNRLLRNRLNKGRVPVDQLIQATDASVTTVPSQEKVFVNIGEGDQVSPGMTFEIFDRNRPVPNPSLKAGGKPSPDSDYQGKAALEVTRVLANSSECRVIRKDPGATITVGDAVVNLIYSKDTKLDFVVYGQFDLNHDKRPSDADADAIRRLVTQWGGQVDDKVTVATDFLVLGSEPAVPNFSQQELDSDPLLRFQRDQAQKQLDEYNAVRDKAVSLSIPVLNQDRFLYFIGYYDLAGR